MSKLQQNLAEKRFDSLPRLKNTEELADEMELKKSQNSASKFASKRTSDLPVGLSKINNDSNNQLISGSQVLKPFISQRSNNQSVMFGQHVDSIMQEGSP